MNAWVAVCLGIAAWFFMCTIVGNLKGTVRRSITFWRFITFLVALGFAAHWWTP